MKKIITLLISFSLFSSMQVFAVSEAKLDKRTMDSATILDEYMADFSNSIPASLLQNAQCVLVVPKIVKAGFVFGLTWGNGVASCRTSEGWSAPSFTKVRGGSWGLIVGAQLTDMVLIFTQPNSARLLQQGDLKLGANAAFAAGPLGRDAQIGTDFLLRSAIYSYSRSRGVYVAASLEGTVINPDNSDNAKYYGRSISAMELLTSSTLARSSELPSSATLLQDRLGAYSPLH